MTVSAGAVLKRLALLVTGDKRTLKTIGMIILTLLFVLLFPVIASVALLNQDIEIDTDRLTELVLENLNAEDRANLLDVENTMSAISSAMTDSGFGKERITEAQVLYATVLYDRSREDDFLRNLVSCFSAEQTDEQLIAAVNETFRTDILFTEFTSFMKSIRSAFINAGRFRYPDVKNNLDLVEWAKEAYEKRWGYVWGTYGTVLTNSLLQKKCQQYPDEVSVDQDFISSHWLGGRTADCIGLIKGYGWFDPAAGEVIYGTNSMPDVDANRIFYDAIENGPIDTLPEIPGLAVWHEGHIGIYVGNGTVIQAADTKIGVIQTPLNYNPWTHWLKIPYITYMEVSDTPPAGS